MTGMQLFAFVILPICVAALGWAIGLASDWQNRRELRKSLVKPYLYNE
jgi:lipopolysaccharide biosynthesis regulator YciM